MDIITTTEIEALNLERNEQFLEAARLRRDVQQILIKAKQPRSNLTNDQKQAIKEIKSNPEVVIYPYDKGTGFVRLSKEQAYNKMIEGIGDIKILKKDPTATHLKKNPDNTLRYTERS